MLTTLLLMLPFTHRQAVRIVQRPNKLAWAKAEALALETDLRRSS